MNTKLQGNLNSRVHATIFQIRFCQKWCFAISFLACFNLIAVRCRCTHKYALNKLRKQIQVNQAFPQKQGLQQLETHNASNLSVGMRILGHSKRQTSNDPKFLIIGSIEEEGLCLMPPRNWMSQGCEQRRRGCLQKQCGTLLSEVLNHFTLQKRETST